MMSFTGHNHVRYKYPANLSIMELPNSLTDKIIFAWDHNPERSNWRAVVLLAERLKQVYSYSREEVIKIGNSVFNGSPGDNLFSSLGSRGMVVSELVEILDQLRIESALLELKNYEPIQLLGQPACKKLLKKGDTLELEVKATGFPFPKYQWFKLDDDDWIEVPDARESVLRINKVRLKDEGDYCCRIHNGSRPENCVFSDESTVSVEETGVDEETSASYPTAVTNGDSEHKVVLPQILVQPVSCQVTPDCPMTLTCEAIGQRPLFYTWFKDNKCISGSSESTSFTIPVFNKSHAGLYTCEVKNNFGKIMSEKATVRLKQEVKAIDIILNPKSCIVDIGGFVMFNVEARVHPDELLTYEWYKDGKPIQEKNAHQKEYRISNVQDIRDQGSYMCKVSCGSIHQFSKNATLTIHQSPLQEPEFRPTDKIALLIGNDEYLTDAPLKAPPNDVRTMAEIFRNLDFKVVSLMNLTKQEMLAAVQEFVSLLGRGVYAVFYFCGHGFEENGKCYFVPSDAIHGYTTEQCVSSAEVHKMMKKPEPAMIVLILDICRTLNKSLPIQQKPCITDKEIEGTYCNTIYIYATREGMEAFEDSKNGILTKYLSRYIHENISMIDVFKKVADDWSRESHHSQKQQPEFRTSFFQHQRSLADKIITTGYTKCYEVKNQLWQNAHNKPSRQTHKVEKLGGLEFELDFQIDYSNVMVILAKINNVGHTYTAEARVFDIPMRISSNKEESIRICNNPITTKITLKDLQKLRENLFVRVKVLYKVQQSDKGWQEYEIPRPINLGKPLIATLDLWKERSQEPIEHLEDFSYSGKNSKII